MLHLLQYAAVALLAAAVRRLDDDEADALARALGRAGYFLLRRRRRVALDNLRAAWGGCFSEEEAERVARGAFTHFAAVSLEILRFPLLGKEECAHRVRVEGWEHLLRAHAEGKGVLLCAAHFGNWEIAALAQGWRGLPMTMMTRELDNPYIERMLARLREASGNAVLHKHDSVRSVLRALREEEIVVIVVDQSYRAADTVLADFMGRPAATTPAAALLALRTGAPIVMAIPEREGFNRYVLRYEPCPPSAATGDRRADVENLTRAVTARLEAHIRRRPEQWLWMHERWRLPATMIEGAPAKLSPAPDVVKA